MTLVKVNNLSKTYGDTRAVDGISFEIQRGEILGLLGPNGAGKSTTIDMLCAYTEPTGGQIYIDGINVVAEPERVKPFIGVVPQDIALYPDLNAVENLRFFGRLYDIPADRLAGRIEELLRLVGLHEKRKERAEHYSGGMKRRLNLAGELWVVAASTVAVWEARRFSWLKAIVTTSLAMAPAIGLLATVIR